MAAPWVDWRLAAEIEPFPREVLQQRFGYKLPDNHNQGDPLLWGDMTEVTPELARQRGVPLPDLLVAGTPCQAFSIAGLRKGTDDERGNLTLKFVETCHAIADARPDGKLAVLWENVPGVLSDKGNAFGCFLGGLVGAMDALPSPDGGSWPSEGMVQGPRSRAAWCVLDAQFFGVAQRRRRVFVVVDFGGACDPAQVLLEPESLRGDRPTRKKAGEGVTGFTAGSFGGYHQGVGTLKASGRDYGGGSETLATWPAEVTSTLNAQFGDKMGLEDQHALNGASMFVPVNDCFGLSTAVTPKFANELSPTITVPSPTGGGQPPAVAFSIMPMNSGKDYKARETEVSQPLMAGGPVGGNQGGDFVVDQPPQVRRLTPTECARLQGFPDNHCAITVRNKPAADGNRYKAYGNSMAVPCIAWIINRMTPERGTAA